MGHERVGRLPRSTKWAAVVDSLPMAAVDPAATARIAESTLESVRDRLNRIEQDPGVAAAFEYLLALPLRAKDPKIRVTPPVPDLRGNPAPARLAAAMGGWVDVNRAAGEYAEIAKQATADTIAYWSTKGDGAPDLFGPLALDQKWGRAADGAGFSELAREFFARFTQRYLTYFLDREASRAVSTLEQRNDLARNLDRRIGSVAQHAFETSKITQSFAAGWYNKNARGAQPTRRQVRAFLRLAFQKIREELGREAAPE